MKINLMIVDDSIIIRAFLKDLIESDPKKRFQIVASAKDGEDALYKLKHFKVDVVTMDIQMPIKNGIETLREIMTHNPKPVIMFSSLTSQGAKETIESLALGAVDFVQKPKRFTDLSLLKEEIYEKLETAYTAKKNITKKKSTIAPIVREVTKEKIASRKTNGLSNLIAIGVSAGGPKTLYEFVSSIPKDFPGAILIVQHMPKGNYIESLAKYLNANCCMDVREAVDGEVISDGNILLATSDYHMEVYKRIGNYHVVYNTRERFSGHRPSVDILFSSLARLKDPVPIYGVVLTGMGSDGLKGAEALNRAGQQIICQSEESARIFGMPKQVINANLAHYVLDVEGMVAHLLSMFNK